MIIITSPFLIRVKDVENNWQMVIPFNEHVSAGNVTISGGLDVDLIMYFHRSITLNDRVL